MRLGVAVGDHNSIQLGPALHVEFDDHAVGRMHDPDAVGDPHHAVRPPVGQVQHVLDRPAGDLDFAQRLALEGGDPHVARFKRIVLHAVNPTPAGHW